MDSAEQKGLTREEDDSLRRLAWFAETVGVSHWARTRIEELRSRDRRSDIRPPREEVIAECAADILQRADIPQRPMRFDLFEGNQLASSNDVVGAPPAGLGLAAEASKVETLELAAPRKSKRRRHPWSLRKAPKAS